MTSPAGRIVGNYELGEPIGRGGGSEVFAAVHRFLGHEVAVKLLRKGGDGDAAASVDAFLGEAARARAVHHPNLVSVLDFGRDDASGRCYLVMERIPGESLAERLGRLGRLSEPQVRALGAALADGMQAAHDGGIVHRDLKPANVMLRGDQPTVVDFGLARDLGGQSAVETGRRAGTPAYMAPEQLTGGLIAPCVDIWSLGVILFEALAGKLPFEGFADGRCPQLFEVAPRLASLVGVSAEMDALVAACLERAPGRRPASMAAVARALRGEGDERITQDIGHATGAGDAGAAPEVAGRSRRTGATRRGVWAAVAAAGVALALLAIGGAGSDREVATDVVGAGGATGVGPAARASSSLLAGQAMPDVVGAGGATGVGPAARASSSRLAGQATPAGAGPVGAPAASAPVSAAPASAPVPSADSAPASATGLDLEIRSTPPGADVLVAGELRGRTPTRLHLAAPGSILLRKRGYEQARVRVQQGGLVDVRLSRRARAGRGRDGAAKRPRASERAEGLD
jgi:serine/threonine-protein kinase